MTIAQIMLFGGGGCRGAVSGRGWPGCRGAGIGLSDSRSRDQSGANAQRDRACSHPEIGPGPRGSTISHVFPPSVVAQINRVTAPGGNAISRPGNVSPVKLPGNQF